MLNDDKQDSWQYYIIVNKFFNTIVVIELHVW